MASILNYNASSFDFCRLFVDKKKEAKEKEELSEEDKVLKEELDLCVTRLGTVDIYPFVSILCDMCSNLEY